MWVRGLKQKTFLTISGGSRVAPYVGAWIETSRYYQPRRSRQVAPYVGAWIETLQVSTERLHNASHPMWVRGLKQQYDLQSQLNQQSHPMWVRGLKPFRPVRLYLLAVSHPMWVRGLKHAVLFAQPILKVAPYVGAWIETLLVTCYGDETTVAPYVGAWIETASWRSSSALRASHPMWVRGLKRLK